MLTRLEINRNQFGSSRERLPVGDKFLLKQPDLYTKVFGPLIFRLVINC